MNNRSDRRRRRDLARSARPTLEGLEGRQLLFATAGGQWSHPSRITFSFVPDGTSVGGTPSTLFQSMNADPNAPNWVAAIANAAAVWQQVTGINLEPVPDNGAALGSGPDQQGDPNHGDIRIAATPMGAGTLAMTFAPPPINGGDLAGDIVFNTVEPWTTNGGTYDLETVAIHELGHALGMGHSAIASAVMYASYNGPKQALTLDDTLGIQSLYGPQPSDPYANLPLTAYNVTGQLNAQGQLTQVMPGPQRTPLLNNGDWFYVQAPANTSGTLTVAMQATGFSLLQPDVAVLDGGLTKVLG
ncbi:MAG TPA: matrixin family metalloprotease, partial [Isosphaeraceae bacterium]|nr:matrixin family metalloprotease [Isosphaeraceae bacterium]